MSFDLFEFQSEAVQQLREAIAEWIQTIAERGRQPINVDGDGIPFIGHISAITGAGKTPILAAVMGDIGPAVVLWTTNRSVVVDQTVKKLNTAYRHFLPANATIIGEEPTPAQLRALLEDVEGVFVWCRSVASWNAPEDTAKGTGSARLNIHRPSADRAGGRTPWDQLGDPDIRRRPLWIVYDESHGQTDNQLDQLLGLHPAGVVAASATPLFPARIESMRKSLGESAVFGPIAAKAMVEVSTQAVAQAGLLKTTIEMDDLNTDDISRIKAASDQLAELDRVAAGAGIHLNPRAIFVVEESNKNAGDSRPKIIWEMLTQRCAVPPTAIAVATNTVELPQDAERITSLSQLKDRHRFLIFNKKFQEGWDDPEAYVAYFDGETKSTLRIKQLIGRIIRQPGANPFDGLPELNTAYVFVSADDKKFAALVDGIRSHLVDEYGRDATGKPNVDTRTRSERPETIPLRPEAAALSLPMLVLGAVSLEPVLAKVTSAGGRKFPPGDLEMPGQIRKLSFNLSDLEKKLTEKVIAMGGHIRANHRDYFLERVRTLSRRAWDALPDNILDGPMFAQDSATLSPAQDELRRLATEYVAGFEERADYQRERDPKRNRWHPTALQPTRPATLAFNRSLHASYPDIRSFLNDDERAMCQALDATGEGWWMRNPPAAGQGGYGIPMAIKVGSSENFYPDFLWWVDKTCFAIDTTGLQILASKIRGKLLAIPEPRIALVTRGLVASSFERLEDQDGWTLVLPSPNGPRRLHHSELGAVLTDLRSSG